jgi:hypothetical protein
MVGLPERIVEWFRTRTIVPGSLTPVIKAAECETRFPISVAMREGGNADGADRAVFRGSEEEEWQNDFAAE